MSGLDNPIGTAFKNNTSIVKVDFKFFTGITNMTGDPFYGCSALNYVNMPPNLLTTAEVFEHVYALKKITFHEGYKTASYCLFENVSATNVVLDFPSTLRTMNGQMARNGGAFKITFVLRGDVGDFGPIKTTGTTIKIYVPDECLSNYQAYLAGNGNLSKLAPLSEYIEKPWDEV